MKPNTTRCKKALDLLPHKNKAIVAIINLYLTLIISCSDTNTSTFDADIWRAQKNTIEKNNPRATMIKELEEKYIRLGMSRQQIITLLGEPDTSTKNIDIYEIGTPPFSIGLEVYEINYQGDIVVGFRIRRG